MRDDPHPIAICALPAARREARHAAVRGALDAAEIARTTLFERSLWIEPAKALPEVFQTNIVRAAAQNTDQLDPKRGRIRIPLKFATHRL